MSTSFGQARKDATRMISFLKALNAAEEVFDAAAAASDELGNLRKDIMQCRLLLQGLRKKVEEEGLKVDAAVADSILKIGVAASNLEEARDEANTQQKRLEAKTAEAQASYDHFCNSLGKSRVHLKELHDEQIEKMGKAKKIAQASLDKVEKQRQEMIRGLQGEAADG